MAIYETTINKPVTTILCFVAVIIVGIYCYLKLPIDQFPEIDPPYVTVMTTYAGASASEVETNITKVLENNLNSVDHLDEMTSTSKDNFSMVMLKFDWGTDLDEVINDVRSYIDFVKDDLPDGAGTPFIFKFSSSSMPIIQYSVTANESYPALEKLLNDEIIPQLNRVNGVGNLSTSGEPDRYVYVYCDEQKLNSYGLSLESISQAISSNNVNATAGTIKMNKEQYNMEIRSEFSESAEIGDIVVRTTAAGDQVHVRDVATVKDTIKELTLDEKANGHEAVRLIVTKQTGGNTVQICRDLRKEMAKIQKTLPSDVKINVIYDSSEDIQNAINSLEESIMYALLFVVLVVLFFLGKWRAAFIVGITIPISLIVGFIYLKAAGSSLNIISLCSLNIAIGMVVDDAIVVLENITKHIDRGANPREAAIYATNEVWISVIATTLVIVAVFVPLTMLTGLAGIMFKELGWIVTIVCCTSTAVAISLTPMLCSKMLKARSVRVEDGVLVEEEEKHGWYRRFVIGLLDKLDAAYARMLRWCLNHKSLTLVALLIFFGMSLLPALTGQIGTDFMAQQDNGRLSVVVELQRGTRIDETLKLARRLESRIQELTPEMKIITTTAGSNDEAGVSALFTSTTNNKIQMTVVCNKKYQRDRSIFEIAEQIRKELATYPEIIEYQCNVSSGMGGNSASTVDVEIYGYDFDQTNRLAEQMKRDIEEKVPGARDVTNSREKERSEIKVDVDKEKAARSGLSSATVAGYARNRIYGVSAGYLREDGDEYPILVRLPEEDRNSFDALRNLNIPSPTGANVKLGELATLGEYWAPQAIERKSRQRVLTLKVTPYNTSLGELATSIEKEVVDKTQLPAGVTVRLAGSYEDQQDSFRDMGLLLALIVILVYIVMASQFESYAKPAIIMLTIPFALSGVILALWITQTNLDMVGALGVIMLVGIVVKNGIVLVDYINLMRERGYELNEAIALSGASRLRPVLMTAFTTVLGMVPMALSTGDGSEMWQPMGIVVIGGLTVSTLLTLLVVPVFYALISRHGDRTTESESNRRNFIFMQIDPDKSLKSKD